MLNIASVFLYNFFGVTVDFYVIVKSEKLSEIKSTLPTLCQSRERKMSGSNNHELSKAILATIL